MARIISNTSEYLDSRDPLKVRQYQQALLRTKTRASGLQALNTVLNTADKIVSSPALIGGIAAAKQIFSGDDREQMIKKAAEARSATAAGGNDETVVNNVLAKFGDPSQVPSFVTDTLTPAQQQMLQSKGVQNYVGQAVAGLPSQPAPASPPPAAPQPRQPIDARVAEMAADQARTAQPGKEMQAGLQEAELLNQEKLAKKSEAEVRAAEDGIKQLMRIAKYTQRLADTEEDANKRNQLRRESAGYMEQAKSRLSSAGLDWRLNEDFEQDPQYNQAVVSLGDSIVDRGQEYLDSVKVQLLQKTSLTPAEKELLAYLEDVAPGKVGSVARVQRQGIMPSERAPRRGAEGAGDGIDDNLPDEVVDLTEQYGDETAPELPKSVAAGVTPPVQSESTAANQGPAELVSERIGVLQNKRRTPYEDYELQLLQAQRIPATQDRQQLTEVPQMQRKKEDASPEAQEAAFEYSFDLNTQDGIYAAARQADTHGKQAMVLAAASHIMRPERKAPSNIFEAMGFGGPTQATGAQINLVRTLFPVIQTQSEKDYAAAQLSYARAQMLREQSKLTSEKTETERQGRGAKIEVDLAKAFGARASAFANLDRAKAAMIRAGKSGKGKGTAAKALKASAKDATTANHRLRTTVENRKKELESEEREKLKFANPGSEPKDPTAGMNPELVALTKSLSKQKSDWVKDSQEHQDKKADYDKAQARLKEIDEEKKNGDAIVQETFANDEKILNDAREGVTAVKNSLKKGTAKRDGKPPPSGESREDEAARILRGG